MLRLVSDNNDFSTVDRLEFNRVCLNADEEDAVAPELAEGGIILVDERHRPYVSNQTELDPEGRPRLKEFVRGPFALTVMNTGERTDQSFLVFQLQHTGDPLEDDPSVEKTESGLYLTSKAHIVSHAVGIIPFVDAFRRDIMKEADKADRLLRSAKTRDLGVARAEKDMHTIRTMTRNFMAMVNPVSPDETTVTIGKEAVSDMLASSLEAGADFYDGFWDNMRGFFSPAIRYVGEEHALGRTDLSTPSLIMGK